jgi:S1-C subfamily serine protease
MLMVSVVEPLEGRKLGIKLSEDDLELVKFTDPRAMRFGFSVGDRVIQVNERPVSNQTDFMEALQDAFGRRERFGEAMKFKVLRPVSTPALQPPVVPALPLLHRHTLPVGQSDPWVPSGMPSTPRGM